MRVKAELFIAAIIRRVFSAGGFAAVERHGSDEAGAIFFRQRHRDGSVSLYAPAPQSELDPEDRDSRLFEVRLEKADPQAADDLMARELRFDPDLWMVEIEAEDVSELFPVNAK